MCASTFSTGIPIFRGDGPLNRHLYVAVVADNERCVAAQFERELRDSAGALLHQQFADLGKAPNAQLMHSIEELTELRHILEKSQQTLSQTLGTCSNKMSYSQCITFRSSPHIVL
jgi:hypothetical protein